MVSPWHGEARDIPMAVFREAARYHDGGHAGLPNWIGPREIPAILEQGELVLTRGQQRALRDGLAAGARSGPVITMTQHIAVPTPSHYRASAATIGAGLHRQIQRLARHV